MYIQGMNLLSSGTMSPADDNPKAGSIASRAAALGVHLLTAFGAGLALIAMLQAVREHWVAMFGWLGLALIVDAIDGPLARTFNVARLQPNWSGDTLDLVVDFLTYVFIPAYAIAASNLLPPIWGALLGIAIVTSSALYFADTRMKTDDNYFRGFPALWNVAAFYLFLLRPSAPVASIVIVALVILTFVPIKVLHPVRTVRLRPINLALIGIWAVLALLALLRNFDASMPVNAAMCAIALYVLFGNTVVRIIKRIRA